MSKTKSKYKIKCLRDGKIFDTMEEACAFYGKTKDAIAWRLSDGVDHKDGWNWERVIDNTEALESVKAVQSQPFVEKFGDKTVPLPGYEDKYTISTSGVITSILKHNAGKVCKVKSQVKVKNTVILHRGNITQVHNVENLLKKAFGDPEAEDQSQNQ